MRWEALGDMCEGKKNRKNRTTDNGDKSHSRLTMRTTTGHCTAFSEHRSAPISHTIDTQDIKESDIGAMGVHTLTIAGIARQLKWLVELRVQAVPHPPPQRPNGSAPGALTWLSVLHEVPGTQVGGPQP